MDLNEPAKLPNSPNASPSAARAIEAGLADRGVKPEHMAAMTDMTQRYAGIFELSLLADAYEATFNQPGLVYVWLEDCGFNIIGDEIYQTGIDQSVAIANFCHIVDQELVPARDMGYERPTGVANFRISTLE